MCIYQTIKKKCIIVAYLFACGVSFINCDAEVVSSPLVGKGAEQRLIAPVVGIIVDTGNEEDSGNSNNGENSGESDRISGSGFIIDKSGLIVTNYHVIEGSSKIEVLFHNGLKSKAKLIGKDSQYDTALLQVNVEELKKNEKLREDLSTVSFGDSDNIEITTPILVSGHPFGLNTRVTCGIISSKVRSLSDQVNKFDFNGDMPFLQIDAKVDHGDSGAPLFTYDCKVIGMVTVFMSDGLQNTGIGFAIPSNLLKKVITQLKNFGKVKRSWIGISAVPLSREVENALGLGKRSGFAISEVEKASPADLVGIKEDDILLSLNGENITENTNPEYVLSNLPLNKVIPVIVMRSGIEKTFNVMVGVKEDKEYAVAHPMKKEITYQKIDYLSIGVSELTSDLKKYFSIPDKINGVLIANVENESSNMSVGNVILAINQKKIANVADLISEMRNITESKADGVTLHVYDPARTQHHLYIMFSLVYSKTAK